MQLPGLQKAVLNLDDLEGLSWANKYNSSVDIIGYGNQALSEEVTQPIKGYLQVRAVQMQVSGLQMAFQWRAQSWSVTVPVIGRFNAENIAATVGVLCAYDYSVSEIKASIEAMHGAPGRMQCFTEKGKPTVYVDYAHTTDGLAKALQAVREHSDAHLVTVFGCGGDRDASKRAPMGQLAAQYSDTIVLTSDNPRSEDPQQILKQIEQGVIAQGFDLTKLAIESDREKAIFNNILNAKPTDVLLIAGKGHETTQKLDGYTIACDDRAIVKKALQVYK
jgi:UDP-N-acetylmuramoyl-L-alanyl-D-glutamate--2,6-diaminopimelate ligase